MFIANVKMQTHMLYEFYLKHIYVNYSQLYNKYVNRNLQQISYKEMVYKASEMSKHISIHNRINFKFKWKQ